MDAGSWRLLRVLGRGEVADGCGVWKSVAMTVVFLLALGNVLTMLQVMGKHRLLPLRSAALIR